ncbi:Hsp70-like protein [Phytophthora cinnamomi]|uniref:Hsp70-like protein n=1 Tax=Phytophthora cinnamomi TaxID=4785 RepID=UPI00355A46E1|nr:Hsp70-like protein [Phytophthora cinnamomi]
MLDAIALSEEELGLLFAPTSHGAGEHVQLRSGGRKTAGQARAAPSGSALKHAASKKKKPKKVASAMSSGSFLTTTGAAVPARCGYRTGKCQNLQAFKRNGKLHKLCEFHRERANLNQKKLDRKKRMQRSKLSAAASPCESVTSEDDARSVDMEDRSPRAVEAAVTSSVFVKTEPITTEVKNEPDPELVLPTSLHEAPLALGCEELAIFCSLMAFDMNLRAPAARDSPPVRTPSCHYSTNAV